jgi:UDP-N-acetylmuramyl pentapeptide phosphotransferase/UDP-N-acetylglucosamine-1-phosphate transferase
LTEAGLWLGLTAIVLTALGLGPLRSLLQHFDVIDRPNGRSSHRHPTPSGAGWLLVPVAMAGFVATDYFADQLVHWPLLVGAICLMAISGLDDIRPLSPWPRLACQAFAVSLVLCLIPADQRLFNDIPLEMERLLIGLGWLWYINLFNFMDGLDGLSAIEILSIGGGVVLIGALAGGLPDQMVNCGLILVGTACGFLIWNWHPARMFMGDVGSIPFGFLLGWVLLSLAYNGQWVEAVLLSLFHLADATSTLASRLLRRERVWLAHREHAYQQPVQAGWPHDRVVSIVAAVKIALLVLAVSVAADAVPVFASLVIAVLMVFGVIVGFHQIKPTFRTVEPRALPDLSDLNR